MMGIMMKKIMLKVAQGGISSIVISIRANLSISQKVVLMNRSKLMNRKRNRKRKGNS